MLFNQIIGQEHIKNHLIDSANKGRIPHAQLFVGKEGSGTLPMAIAYAQYLLCSFSKNKDACNLKCNSLQHPDMHFAFPVTTNNNVKKNPVSSLFVNEWINFIKNQPYGNLFDWLQHIGVENKQGVISKFEAVEINKKLKLKSYEGGFKIMIIWMAEKMNITTSNKLLKAIEEPHEKTILILITENEDEILSTIKSRCQAIYFNSLNEQDISNSLITSYKVSKNKADKIAYESEGNYNKAINLLQNDKNDSIFEEWFIILVRAAFKAKRDITALKKLIEWTDTISKTGRETQKIFLEYCLQIFRQAMLINYNSENLAFMEFKREFDFSKFVPFVNSKNILDIEKELSNGIYHIERNGNPKIIFLDISIKISRFLHKKENF